MNRSITRFEWRLLLALLVAVVLAACGQLPQPFEKEAPLSNKDQLVAPPWQAMVKAGPGASQDLDLETLNGPQPGANNLATQDPAIADNQNDLAKADAARPAEQKPARSIKAVVVAPVTGNAPAGNAELAAAMRNTLKKAGWPVRDKAGKDTLTVAGRVKLGEPRGTAQTVTLAWDVISPDGGSLGLVSQTNDVQAGSLDHGWGDQAVPAVEAAATGIFELIDKFR